MPASNRSSILFTPCRRVTPTNISLPRFAQAFALDVYRVIFKDPGGILTPERTKT